MKEWNQGQVKGALENDPFEIPNLHAGQTVVVREEDIFDYIRQYADKHQEGNTTGEIIKKLESLPKPQNTRVSTAVVPECGAN